MPVGHFLTNLAITANSIGNRHMGQSHLRLQAQKDKVGNIELKKSGKTAKNDV